MLRSALAFALPLLGCLPQCAAPERTVRTEFWQEAPQDPHIDVEPASLLPMDATSTVLEIRGVVINHRRQTAGTGEFVLDLLVDTGDYGKAISLAYSVGENRKIAVDRGTLVRIVLLQEHLGPARPVRALLVESVISRTFLRRPVALAIVQANGLLPPALLPKALRAIQPGEEVLYRSAARLEGECVRSAAHREFRITDPNLRDVAPFPGARVRMTADADNYDIVLGDNREILGTDCADLVPSYWVFSALVVPPPAGTRIRKGDLSGAQTSASPNAILSLPPTPTTAGTVGANKKDN